MIKAVFFDLDGTLLDSKKRIPLSARKSIMALREKGVKVFFASARSPRLRETLKWTDAEFSLFDGAIYANGACVEEKGDMRYRFIDPKAVRICLEHAQIYNDIHISLALPGDGYAFNFPVDDVLNEVWGLDGAKVLEINDDTISHTIKIMMFYNHLSDSHPLPVSFTENLSESCAPFANVYLTDAGCTIQVTGKDSGKLNAIEDIRKRLNLNIGEISVFGDDVNDLEMIRFYPNSVAMGNGTDAVKQSAGFITLSNDEDGVMYALKNILKIY